LVDYVEAIKRPFTDLKKFVIGVILSVIPIVNLIFTGYLLNTAETAMRKQKELPEFEGFGKLFVDGLLAAIIGLIYMIPVFLLFGILYLVGLATIPSVADFTNGGFLAALFGGFGITFILLLITGFIFTYLATGAMLRFAERRKFGEAFDLGEITKKVLTGAFFLPWLISVVLGGVINFVLRLIPVVGWIVGPFVVGVFMYTILGAAYSEA
jgi:hypothetical protein